MIFEALCNAEQWPWKGKSDSEEAALDVNLALQVVVGSCCIMIICYAIFKVLTKKSKQGGAGGRYSALPPREPVGQPGVELAASDAAHRWTSAPPAPPTPAARAAAMTWHA